MGDSEEEKQTGRVWNNASLDMRERVVAGDKMPEVLSDFACWSRSAANVGEKRRR